MRELVTTVAPSIRSESIEAVASDDKPLSTKNAKKTTPRTSTSNAGGLGEVRALSRIPAPRVHGEQCRGSGGGSRFVTYSGAESSWGEEGLGAAHAAGQTGSNIS